MNIIRTAPVAFCPDGLDTIEFLLGSAIPHSLIEYLVSMGRTEYFPRFAHPFFRISRCGSFIVEGIGCDATIQVSYFRPPSNPEQEIISRILIFQSDIRKKEAISSRGKRGLPHGPVRPP